MVVGRIADRQFAPGETLQQLGRRAALTGRIRVRAPEEQVHLVFNSETQRVRALTAVRHSAISVSVLVACGEWW